MSISQCQCKPTAQSYIKAIFMVEILTQKSGNSELWFPQPTITRGSFSVLHYYVYTPQCMSKYRDWVIAAVGTIALDFSVFFHLNSQPRLWTIVKINGCSTGQCLQFAVLGYCWGCHGRMVNSPCGVDDGKPKSLFYSDKQNTLAALTRYIKISFSESLVSFSRYSGREQGS